MSNRDRKALIEEAADIFVRLREDPDNADILNERRAFLGRGAREREIYAYVTKVWVGTGRRPGPNKTLIFALLLCLGASVYLFGAPVRTMLVADAISRTKTLEIELASGDGVFIDADTAIRDDTDGPTRRVTLLQGAALFDVGSGSRTFEVEVGDGVTVQVLGTVFEVAEMGDLLTVSVSEGQVQVTDGTQGWTLTDGERLRLSEEGGLIEDVVPSDVALWRQDRFVADGLTFEQVADVIARRMRGRVLIGSAALANARVSGTINLETPSLALEALAATKDARIISLPIVGQLILP